jgi:putative sigma-54 modulation protein
MADKGRLPRVLLAEDDEEMRKLIVHALGSAYEVTECSDGYGLFKHLHSILELKQDESFDVVISDIRMPGLTGIDKPFEIADLLAKVREITSSSKGPGPRDSSAPRTEKGKIHFPLQIVFRSGALHSAHVERMIRRSAAKLDRFHESIANCRVVVDIPHNHHRRGNQCRVEIILSVAGRELVANHNGEYAEIDVAVRKKFEAAARRLKAFLEQKSDAQRSDRGAADSEEKGG